MIIVFDVCDESSFANVPMWIREVERYAKPGVPMILVGNKTDLTDKRKISRKDAQAFADAEGLAYIEVSAKEDSVTLLTKVFLLMVESIRGESGLCGGGWVVTRVEQKDDVAGNVSGKVPGNQLRLARGSSYRRLNCCSS